MNHSHYGIYNKYTTLVLGHRKLAIDKPLAQASSDLRLGSYICCIHLLAVVYILHIYMYIYVCVYIYIYIYIYIYH